MTARRAAALAAIVRARAIAVDAARRALQDAIAAEDVATVAARAASEAILVETAAATRAPDDAAVETFARWLVQVGRPAQRRAEAVRARAEADGVLARAALGLARGDALAAERAAAAHAAAERREAAHRAAHADDDRARDAQRRRDARPPTG